MSENKKNKLVVFLDIPGWGVSLNSENNAIRKANIPGFKELVSQYPATVISLSNLSPSDFYSRLGLGKNVLEPDFSNHLSVSKIISQASLSQLKITESDDFPLASVFFNNNDSRFLGEDWLITDNKNKDVLNFFNKNNLVEVLCKNIRSGRYNFILSILSNISHEVLAGDFLAIISAVEEVSLYLEKISRAVLSADGVLIISSSQGGAEDAYNVGTGIANKKRTTNLAPFIVVGHDFHGKNIGLEDAPNNDLSLISAQGTYLDIAPTILKILDLKIPPEMEGESLL